MAISHIGSTAAFAEALSQAHASYADLNLSSGAGIKAFNGRIEAAKGFCGDTHSSWQLAEHGAIRECTQAARRSAQNQMAAAFSSSESQQAPAQTDVKIVRQ